MRRLFEVVAIETRPQCSSCRGFFASSAFRDCLTCGQTRCEQCRGTKDPLRQQLEHCTRCHVNGCVLDGAIVGEIIVDVATRNKDGGQLGQEKPPKIQPSQDVGAPQPQQPLQPEQVQPAQQSLQVHRADRQARVHSLLREAVQTLQPGAAISAEHGQEKPPEPATSGAAASARVHSLLREAVQTLQPGAGRSMQRVRVTAVETTHMGLQLSEPPEPATPPYVPPNTQATPESPNTQATPESPNSPNKDPWRLATMGETYCQRCRKKIVVDIDSEFDLCQCWTAVPDGVTARRANLPRAPRFEEPAGDHSDQPREPGPLAKARIKVLRREMHQGGAG